MKTKIERLIEIKKQKALLQEEQEKIEESLPDLEIITNEDGTWTRFSRVNNLEQLEEGKTVWKSCGFSKYSCEIKILKTLPKELK